MVFFISSQLTIKSLERHIKTVDEARKLAIFLAVDQHVKQYGKLPFLVSSQGDAIYEIKGTETFLLDPKKRSSDNWNKKRFYNIVPYLSDNLSKGFVDPFGNPYCIIYDNDSNGVNRVSNLEITNQPISVIKMLRGFKAKEKVYYKSSPIEIIGE